MEVLKQIKFGTKATPIAKTVLTAKEGGVMSVAAPTGVKNEADEPDDYQYELDVNIDGTTLVKSTTGEGQQAVTKLAVGTVPAAQVSVATGTGLTATDAQAAFKELKNDINTVGGAAKSYTIVKNTKSLATNVKEQYLLQETVGETNKTVGEPINIYKDSSLKSVELVDQKLVFTYILADGSEKTVSVDVSTFLAESEFTDGLQVTNHVVSVKIDETSEDFLTVSEAGVKLAGVQNAIDAKVAALDVTDDNAVEGQYVAAIQETDGIVSVKARANVSDAKLNGYVKGTDANAILATDSLKVALGKLENQVDKAKAAATTKVVKGTDDGNNLSIASVQSDVDGSTTYTINLTDVASKKALNAEIAARKAVDGQDGPTYVANNGTNYISGAKSLNDADVKLDAALKAEANRANSAETSIDAAIGLTKGGDNETRTYTNAGEYIGKGETNTVASDIKALDTKLNEVANGLAAVQYKVSGTTLEFFGISENKTV